MYVAAFAIGFGPIPWVMNVELFPREARVSKHFFKYLVSDWWPFCKSLFAAANHVSAVHHLQLDVFLPGGQSHPFTPGNYTN
jgi:hypothetical protein